MFDVECYTYERFHLNDILVFEGQGQNMGPPARPPSPMFVSVPPRTQRLLHSEAYLRYSLHNRACKSSQTLQNKVRINEIPVQFFRYPLNCLHVCGIKKYILQELSTIPFRKIAQ